MKTHSATTSVTQICPAGPRRFIHIENVSDTDVYLQYDGDSATLTTVNGFKLAIGATLMLNNTPLAGFTDAVNVIHGGAGSKDLRIQGVS